MEPRELDKPYWLLRVAYGAVPIVAGLDKFTNLLTDWEQYLNPLVGRLLPAGLFLQVVGLIEIAAGALVLSRHTRLGASVVALWLVGIALNLLVMGRYLDVAVRDLVLAGGAFTLARLEAARSSAAQRPVQYRTGPVSA